MLSEDSVNTQTHIDTWMIGQYAVVGQCDILLLPLLVERVSTALQQDTLMEVTATQEREFIAKYFCVRLTGFSNTMNAGCSKHLHHSLLEEVWCPLRKAMKNIIFVSVPVGDLPVWWEWSVHFPGLLYNRHSVCLRHCLCGPGKEQKTGFTKKKCINHFILSTFMQGSWVDVVLIPELSHEHK